MTGDDTTGDDTTGEDMTGAVCASLEALAAHVAALPADAYAETTPELAGSSIGMHVRHCLDHYATLLQGLRTGRFDYDQRGRAVDVECDRECAARWARSLRDDLGAILRDTDLTSAVDVRTASTPNGQVDWQRSSVGRELQFLVSHTVHHSAMVAASCRVRGLPVSADHGVAPSTLRHRAATS
ncbi:MAG: DinB family protein [Planctomycetota bacterium]